MALSKGRTRRGGRAALRKAREARSSAMMPALKRRLPLVEPMDQEQVEKIDDASMDICLLYTSPSPRDGLLSRMPSSA